MGVIVYSFNLNFSPKMLYDVHECGGVMLQNYMLLILYSKRGVVCAGPRILCSTPMFIYIKHKLLEEKEEKQTFCKMLVCSMISSYLKSTYICLFTALSKHSLLWSVLYD